MARAAAAQEKSARAAEMATGLGEAARAAEAAKAAARAAAVRAELEGE